MYPHNRKVSFAYGKKGESTDEYWLYQVINYTKFENICIAGQMERAYCKNIHTLLLMKSMKSFAEK